jgi:hypothetical protein
MDEIILPVPGYALHYSASNLGRVFSNNYRRTGRTVELAQSELVDRRRSSETHYRRAKMWHINRHTPTAIHRVVALTFVPNPLGLKTVNHKDGNKGNNTASNLEWCTNAENLQHAEATGLASHVFGEEHGMHVLIEDEVREIKRLLRANAPYKGQLKEIGHQFGVSNHCIFDIKHGRSWRHVQ